MSRKVISNRVADFETTTNPADCRVWAWASVSIDDIEDIRYGTSIDSFLDFLDERATVTYFHNLAFDATFIVDALFRRGFKWVKTNPGKGEFTSLISNLGKWYSVTMVSKAGVKTEFRDSLKKIPLSVSNIAKAFDLEDHKLEIDYNEPRPVGHVLTEEETRYIRNDVVIVAQALHLQFTAGMKKLTVGADALAEYKSLTGKPMFDRTFPVLPAPLDREIRTAYRGGFTYADPRFRKRIVGEGQVFDVNSLYPFIMHERPIPYGLPTIHPDAPPDDVDAFIASVTFTAKIKPDHIPCIQVKKSLYFNETEYLTRIDEPTTLSATSVDLELWKEQYDLDILSFNGAMSFNTASGMFSNYIDKWMTVKANSKGGMRQIAKLHLNSLYGKFATNTNVTGKVPVFEDNIVRLTTGEHEERQPVYTAAGAFITAWARAYTIRAAQLNYQRFAYADTDSLHLLASEPPAGLTVHDSDLGAWKREMTFRRAVFLRAKQYCEEDHDGRNHAHIAGLPYEIAEKLTVDDMLTSRTFGGKLVPRKVPGGTVLTDSTFTLKV